MRVAISIGILRGEIILVDRFRDARFQAGLDGIACQLIGAVEHPVLEQAFGLGDPQIRETLKIGSIHLGPSVEKNPLRS